MLLVPGAGYETLWLGLVVGMLLFLRTMNLPAVEKSSSFSLKNHLRPPGMLAKHCVEKFLGCDDQSYPVLSETPELILALLLDMSFFNLMPS